VGSKLAGAKPGELFKLEDGDAVELRAESPLLQASSPSDDEILVAAQHSRLS
jgi:hypothetical protein